MRLTLPCLLTAALALAACAADRPVVAAEATAGLQVLVQLAPDAAADLQPQSIATLASVSAGVPVQHVAASGERWHALRVQCPPADCETAFKRLVADIAHFAVVQRDELRRR